MFPLAHSFAVWARAAFERQKSFRKHPCFRLRALSPCESYRTSLNMTDKACSLLQPLPEASTHSDACTTPTCIFREHGNQLVTHTAGCVWSVDRVNRRLNRHAYMQPRVVTHKTRSYTTIIWRVTRRDICSCCSVPKCRSTSFWIDLSLCKVGPKRWVWEKPGENRWQPCVLTCACVNVSYFEMEMTWREMLPGALTKCMAGEACLKLLCANKHLHVKTWVPFNQEYHNMPKATWHVTFF